MNQGDYVNEMGPKTEEIKEEPHMTKVKKQRSPRSSASTTERPATPPKRSSTTEIVEINDDEPLLDVKVECSEGHDYNPDNIPDPEFVAQPVDATPVFRGREQMQEETVVQARRSKSPRHHESAGVEQTVEQVNQGNAVESHAGENGAGEAADSPGEAGSTRESDGRRTAGETGSVKLNAPYRKLGSGTGGDERGCVGDMWDACGTCDGTYVEGLSCLHCPSQRLEVELQVPGADMGADGAPCVCIGEKWCMRCVARLGNAIMTGTYFFGYRAALCGRTKEQIESARHELTGALSFLQDEQAMHERFNDRNEDMAVFLADRTAELVNLREDVKFARQLAQSAQEDYQAGERALVASERGQILLLNLI